MDAIVLQRLQTEVDIMVRCWGAIENGKMPTDEDLLLFNHKGVKWLSVCNGWNGIDSNLVIDRKYYYSIRGIKDCLIVPE